MAPPPTVAPDRFAEVMLGSKNVAFRFEFDRFAPVKLESSTLAGLSPFADEHSVLRSSSYFWQVSLDQLVLLKFAFVKLESKTLALARNAPLRFAPVKLVWDILAPTRSTPTCNGRG